MNKLVVSLSSLVASYVGWWLGEQVGGVMTAFMISMVGTGLGIYAGKRLVGMWDL